MLPERLIYLKALRLKMIGGGWVASVGFMFAQALLAEAGWCRFSTVLAVLGIGGFVVLAAGMVLNLYVYYKLAQYPPERPN